MRSAQSCFPCRYGYNAGYANGHGQTVENPGKYYEAVASDKYGYNGSRRK